MGGLSKDLWEARQFWEVFNRSRFPLGLLLTPRLVDVAEMECATYSDSGVFYPAQYVDILADLWNVYAFGSFDLRGFIMSLPGRPPQTLGMSYRQAGFSPAPGPIGFQQRLPITGSAGRTVFIGHAGGSRTYSEQIHISSNTSKETPRLAAKCPLIHDAGILPSAGQRMFILGGRDCFATSNVADDAYADDAIWRAMPLNFWDRALSWLHTIGTAPLLRFLRELVL